MAPPLHFFKTIAAYHQYMELPDPEHPLISVVRFEDIRREPAQCAKSIVHEFYSIALKKNFNGKLTYGQQPFDFDTGIMHMMAPRQVLTIAPATEAYTHSGWLLLIHPDFLAGTPLAKKIKAYEYFSYHLHEALHLSEEEEALLSGIMSRMREEFHPRTDLYSQEVMLAHITLLLAYTERFYQRQFVTRKAASHAILAQLDTLLDTFFDEDRLLEQGAPSVQRISDALHLSPNYLSRLLKTLTGQSTQQWIQDRLIVMAKEKLSTTRLSVNEIAGNLGFEHPQSFSKLFRSKTHLSPIAFRKKFSQ